MALYNYSAGELQINNCQFNNNGNYAAYLNNLNVKSYTDNTGSGNTINAFSISGPSTRISPWLKVFVGFRLF